MIQDAVLNALREIEARHGESEKLRQIKEIINYLFDGINDSNFVEANKFLKVLCDQYPEIRDHVEKHPIPFTQWYRRNEILYQQLVDAGIFIGIRGAIESEEKYGKDKK